MGVHILFSRGGQEPTFCLKNNKKDTIFPKKSKNILFLAGLGRPGGARVELPLPSPADDHAPIYIGACTNGQEKAVARSRISTFVKFCEDNEYFRVHFV